MSVSETLRFSAHMTILSHQFPPAGLDFVLLKLRGAQSPHRASMKIRVPGPLISYRAVMSGLCRSHLETCFALCPEPFRLAPDRRSLPINDLEPISNRVTIPPYHRSSVRGLKGTKLNFSTGVVHERVSQLGPRPQHPLPETQAAELKCVFLLVGSKPRVKGSPLQYK
jgi:hypothetical protein